MIVDRPDEYWIWLERQSSVPGVYYCPKNKKEYLEHWGKWLIFDSSTALRDLAEKMDRHIDPGEIDSAKFNRKPSEFGRGDCVMCIYCDDRDKERVWKILRLLGISKRIWKYEQQTHEDWKPGGHLYSKALKKQIEKGIL